MKHKLLYTAIVGIFAAQLLTPNPVFAQATEAAATEEVGEPAEMEAMETAETEEATASSNEAEFEGFSITHEVNGETTSSQIGDDPLVLFARLKTDLQAQLEAHGKPLSIVTQIKPIVEAEIEELLQGLPILTITTHIAENGTGNSELAMPEWKRTLPAEEEDEGDLLVELGGLSGNLTYTEQLTEPMIDMTIEAINLEEQDGLVMTLAKSTFSGQFDADMFPLKMALNLPQLTVKEDTDVLLLDEVDINTLTENVAVPEDDSLMLDLTNGTIKIAKIEFSDAEEKVSLLLETLALFGNSSVQDGLVSYRLKNQIGKLVLEGVDAEKLDISYQDDWVLSRLHPGAVARIQKQVRTLQQQSQSGMMSEDMMGMALMGTFMQEMPFLLEKSPQLAINQLNLNTQHGALTGTASIGIDGSKPLNMQEMGAMMQALKANADIRIDEALLKKVLTMQVMSEMGDEAMPEEQLTEMLNMQIQSFTEMNYLVKEGDAFTLTAIMEGGKLMLNGQEIPLPTGM